MGLGNHNPLVAALCALRSLRPGGLCVAVTIYLEDPHVPGFFMYSQGVRLETGRVNARAVMPEVLDLVQAGRIHPLAVTDGVLGFDDVLEAFAEPTLKPIFVREPRA